VKEIYLTPNNWKSYVTEDSTDKAKKIMPPLRYRQWRHKNSNTYYCS